MLERTEPEKKRERPLKKKKLRLNIALITKETDTIYRSVKRSQQNPQKNVRSGSKTPAHAFAYEPRSFWRENVIAVVISTTRFSENALVANSKASYQMLGILSFSDRERALPPLAEIS